MAFRKPGEQVDDSIRSRLERAAAEDLAAIETARAEGRGIPGVFLLEPMPYNARRLDRAFAKEYLALEVPADTRVSFRPLTGLQVWMFGSARNSEWVISVAPLVMSANPRGLYVQWNGQKDDEASQIVVRNPAVPAHHIEQGIDLYDFIRIDGPNANMTQEQAARALGLKMDRLIAEASRMTGVAPPAKTAAPADTALDPGWGDDDE